VLHGCPGGTSGAPVGASPDRLHQRRALEGFQIAVFVEDRFLPSCMHAHGGPVGLLHLQRRREQRALRAAGGDLVALHRRHHGFRAEQAQARDLRCSAVHAQAECT
jgi:hypothetical protein